MIEEGGGLPFGASVVPEGVRFRVWSPGSSSVEVLIERMGDDPLVVPLAPEADGYFGGTGAGEGEGTRYRYRIGGGAAYPDPASRYQPEGVHGPSEVVDPNRFAWSDEAWAGVRLDQLVLYELHVGTFTTEGTFDAAAERLPHLVELGVSAVEVMPIANFAGERNWGYDGVNLYAPATAYGDAHAFRRFVDRAHALGLGVILDVVYNHLGPEGNYLPAVTNGRFFTRGTRHPGATASITTGRGVRRSASSWCATLSTGCASSTSMGCASTQRTPSSTTPRCTSSWRSRPRCIRSPARAASSSPRTNATNAGW